MSDPGCLARYTPEQCEEFAAQAAGKTVESLERDDAGGFWVMTFTDKTEIAFQAHPNWSRPLP